MPQLPAIRPIDDVEAFHPGDPTPLLDAAADRDAAIKRALVMAPSGLERPSNLLPVADAIPKLGPDRFGDGGLEDGREVEPAAYLPPSNPPDVLQDPPPVSVTLEPSPDRQDDDGTLWDYVLSALAESTGPEPSPSREAERLPIAETPIQPSSPTLTIADVRVCRRVLGYGRTEPLESSSAFPSQAFLLYCEVEGLRDEETADGFRSRLAASIAFIPKGVREPTWTGDLGVAEDLCRRRRRDFFVSYRVVVPAELSPGLYDVRITHKDLIAGQDATGSAELVVGSKSDLGSNLERGVRTR